MRPFTTDEEAIATLLHQAGLPRAAARCLVVLSRGGGHAAPALADAATLARQDAAAAGRALVERGLARVEPVPTGGRPALRYHLAREMGESVRALIAARRQALAEELTALDALAARYAQ